MSAGSDASNLGYGNMSPYNNSPYVNGTNSSYSGSFSSNEIPGLPGLAGAKINVDAAAGKVPGMEEEVKRLQAEITKLQEQLAAHIREEEEKSRTVYDPNQNHMEAALKRVMAQQEMDRLVVQIRETMVYQSPPEMGALYSSVFDMKEVIQEEQDQARLKQEAKKRQEVWQRKEEERNFQLKLAYLAVTTIFLLYLWLWLLLLSRWGKA